MRIGVDLGGTKIEIVALDPTGATLLRRRIPSPSHEYGAIVEAIGALVESAEAELGSRGTVGIGTPGSPSPLTGTMRNANSTVLNGKPLVRDLERRLGRTIRVENDANCFALSEASDGNAAGATCAFGAILGTGVGGGIVVRGALLAGANGIAGEWGHAPVPWPRADEIPGPPCYCGKVGCLETLLSGPGFARDHLAHGGTERTAPEIVAAARANAGAARDSLDRYLDRLARALASIVNVLDPDVVVLGGGMSNVAELYAELPARLGAYVFSDTLATRIVPAAHGDSSGVRGAAWLWPLA
jgi:predicted NBD/HSP70 family sugar kinase